MTVITTATACDGTTAFATLTVRCSPAANTDELSREAHGVTSSIASRMKKADSLFLPLPPPNPIANQPDGHIQRTERDEDRKDPDRNTKSIRPSYERIQHAVH